MADTITLTGIIRDFSPELHADLPISQQEAATNHPDFEADFDSNFPVEEGIVAWKLDANHKPVYVGGTSNNIRVKSTHGPAEFAKWYANDHPFQKPFSITLTKTSPNSKVFSYDNQAFFPIDNELLGNDGNPHNYHFTYEVSTEFTYQGGEEFTFTGDDDLWVFIDNKLVIDLGGIHTQATKTVKLNDLSVDPKFKDPTDPHDPPFTVGTNHSLRLFFAERHTTESHFRIDTSILLTQPIATIVASDPNASELGPDQGEFTISLDKAALTDLTVKYSVSGTATEGTDYQTLAHSVLIPKGQTSVKIPVIPIADQLVEGPETVIATLLGSNGYKVGTPNSATVTIQDNPPPAATIVATDPNASELGPDKGEFTISLNKAALIDLTVTYNVSGTATEGTDYQPIPHSVLIPKGQTSAKIPVKPIADQLVEGPETVIATLSAGNGYQIGTPSSATITILDNPPPVALIVATDANASEVGLDPGQFTISLDKAAIADLTIGYTVSGTATEGADYQPIGRSVLIPKGQTSAVIPVKPIADQIKEGDETVIATLQPGNGYRLSPTITATVVIKDNTPPPLPIVTLVASDPSATKPASGQATDMGEFTISLNPPAPTNLTINFGVTGTAIEGQDCKSMPRTATIAQGQSQAKLSVVPLAQTAQRTGAGVTQVTATLQPSSGCQLGTQITGTVTIKVPALDPANMGGSRG